jgi:hypothetical protein
MTFKLCSNFLLNNEITIYVDKKMRIENFQKLKRSDHSPKPDEFIDVSLDPSYFSLDSPFNGDFVLTWTWVSCIPIPIYPPFLNSVPRVIYRNSTIFGVILSEFLLRKKKHFCGDQLQNRLSQFAVCLGLW